MKAEGARDWQWVLFSSCAIMLLASIPQIFGGIHLHRNFVYMGHVGRPDDFNVYFSYIEQVRQDGRLLLTNLYNPQSGHRTYLHVLWWFLGMLGRWSGIETPSLYQGARILSGLLFLCTVYHLASLSFPFRTVCRWSLLTVGLSSGFGWMSVIGWSRIPGVDCGPGLLVPEAISFLSLLGPAHVTLCMALMALWVSSVVLSPTHLSRPRLLLIALIGNVLLNIHPYDILTLTFVCGASILIRLALRQDISVYVRNIVTGLIISSPALVLHIFLWWQDPQTMAGKFASIPSPSPLVYMYSYGLLVLLTLVGSYFALRPVRQSEYGCLTLPSSRAEPLVLITWVVCGFALAYSPFPFQRKALEGTHVPIAILVAFAINTIVEHIRASLPRCKSVAAMAGVLFLLATTPSNVFLIVQMCRELAAPRMVSIQRMIPPMYLTVEEMRAMIWLKKNAREDDVTLCLPPLGNYIPAVTGNRVFLGHWAETLKYEENVWWGVNFYANRLNAEGIRELFSIGSIRYIWYGKWEGLLGSPDPMLQPLLRRVYHNPEIEIYEVRAALRGKGRLP